MLSHRTIWNFLQKEANFGFFHTWLNYFSMSGFLLDVVDLPQVVHQVWLLVTDKLRWLVTACILTLFKPSNIPPSSVIIATE